VGRDDHDAKGPVVLVTINEGNLERVLARASALVHGRRSGAEDPGRAGL